jgi:hypothetical protein
MPDTLQSHVEALERRVNELEGTLRQTHLDLVVLTREAVVRLDRLEIEMKCLPGAIVQALMTEKNGRLIRDDNPQSPFGREVTT